MSAMLNSRFLRIPITTCRHFLNKRYCCSSWRAHQVIKHIAESDESSSELVPYFKRLNLTSLTTEEALTALKMSQEHHYYDKTLMKRIIEQLENFSLSSNASVYQPTSKSIIEDNIESSFLQTLLHLPLPLKSRLLLGDSLPSYNGLQKERKVEYNAPEMKDALPVDMDKWEREYMKKNIRPVAKTAHVQAKVTGIETGRKLLSSYMMLYFESLLSQESLSPSTLVHLSIPLLTGQQFLRGNLHMDYIQLLCDRLKSLEESDLMAYCGYYCHALRNARTKNHIASTRFPSISSFLNHLEGVILRSQTAFTKALLEPPKLDEELFPKALPYYHSNEKNPYSYAIILMENMMSHDHYSPSPSMVLFWEDFLQAHESEILQSPLHIIEIQHLLSFTNKYCCNLTLRSALIERFFNCLVEFAEDIDDIASEDIALKREKILESLSKRHEGSTCTNLVRSFSLCVNMDAEASRKMLPLVMAVLSPMNLDAENLLVLGNSYSRLGVDIMEIEPIRQVLGKNMEISPELLHLIS